MQGRAVCLQRSSCSTATSASAVAAAAAASAPTPPLRLLHALTGLNATALAAIHVASRRPSAAWQARLSHRWPRAPTPEPGPWP